LIHQEIFQALQNRIVVGAGVVQNGVEGAEHLLGGVRFRD